MAHVTEPQPRPVARAARWVAGVSAIAGALPTLLLTFQVIAWTAEQIAAYGTFLGVVVGAISIILGTNAENQVTPTASPRSDDGIPLVPITAAGLPSIEIQVEDT